MDGGERMVPMSLVSQILMQTEHYFRQSITECKSHLNLLAEERQKQAISLCRFLQRQVLLTFFRYKSRRGRRTMPVRRNCSSGRRWRDARGRLSTSLRPFEVI